MADLPSGQPPRIVGPINGVGPVAASGQGARREPEQDPRPRQPEPPPAPEGTPAPAAADPRPPAVPDPLVQALDRLRATSGMRPVDLELARLLRGLREYAANTPPAGNPILPEDPA